MTAGPGARLDAENDNLQAYCDRLEAELDTLRTQLRSNLAALQCYRTAYPTGSFERTRCHCDACKAWVATCVILGMEART